MNKKEKGLRPSQMVDDCAERLSAEVLALDWTDGELYQSWMTQHFYIVRRTMRYINLAAGLSPVEDDATYNYWMHHLKEELNHHRVLEKDAEKFGLRLAEAEPLPVTKVLASSVYHGMIDSSGVFLFGYGALLEGMACLAAAKVADQVESKFGKGAARFLRLHADVDDGDDGHYIGMKKHMDSFSPDQQARIKEAIEVTFSLYREILRTIGAAAGRVTDLRRAG
jgi:hypothetical protein